MTSSRSDWAVRAGFSPRIRFSVPVRAQTPRAAARRRIGRDHAGDRRHHGISRSSTGPMRSDRLQQRWRRSRHSRKQHLPLTLAARTKPVKGM